MKRLALISIALALGLTGCNDLLVGGDDEALAAVKLTGVSKVVLKRPTFRCDARNAEPIVQKTTGLRQTQRGMFFEGVSVDGLGVEGAVCVGAASPPKVKITRTFPRPPARVTENH